MTGIGRCTDNAYIERLWRAFKYEGSYLYQWNTVEDLKANIPDWGKFDEPSIFSPDKPSELSNTIDFVFEQEGVWPADDDTDLEYMYLDLLLKNKTSILSPSQIRDGWIKHIKAEEENFLWVSNQKAFDLMNEGYLPPQTSEPKLNEHYEMIDARNLFVF